MASHNHDLETYFRWLSEQINNVTDEKALSRTVNDVFGLPNTKTLLTALGYPYGSPHVFPEYQVTIATRTYPVDFRIGADPVYWMLELKGPDEICDNPKFVDQIHTYLAGDTSQHRVPPVLAVLFNGREARVYLNLDHPKLRQSEFATLRRKPVATAKLDDVSSLVALFQPLQATDLPTLLDYARRKARESIRQARNAAALDKRRSDILKSIKRILEQPDPAVIEAVISADVVLTALSPRPSVQEVGTLWGTLAPQIDLSTTGDEPSEYGRNWYREKRYNPDSIAAFFDFTARTRQLLETLGIPLDLQYNRGFVAFKHANRRVFRLDWFGSRSFGCFVRMPEPEARRLCPKTSALKRYDPASGEAAFTVDPKRTDPDHFQDLLLFAYRRLIA